MELTKSHAIVLRAVDYGDHDRILTVLTETQGLMALFVPRAKRPKSGLAALTQPLAQAEFVLRSGRGELFRCQEATLLRARPGLRKRLTALESAWKMCRAILDSQPQEKPAPLLYALLSFCLDKLETTPEPETLLAAFRLRLLRHDGLFSWHPSCPSCEVDLQARYYLQGEAFCGDHAPQGSIGFSPEETEILATLAAQRDVAALEALDLSDGFKKRVELLFLQCLAL